jgi:23S rRNA (adenine2030-N6)-methyltransferase
MLSYRHGCHAGNFADTHKHAVLLALLAALQRKAKPLFVLDTHGGDGRYDLSSPEALRHREHEAGIVRLLARPLPPPALQDYLGAVRGFNGGRLPLRHYPGSPLLLAQRLRPGDRLVCCEQHPAAAPALARALAARPQARVERGDGYQALKAYLPPQEKRALLLVDPAYERKDEPERVFSSVKSALRRLRSACVLIWYPLLSAAFAQRMRREAAHLAVPKTLLSELWLHPPGAGVNLKGSGLLLLNTPWMLDRDVAAISEALARLLAGEPPGHAVTEWLTSSA